MSAGHSVRRTSPKGEKFVGTCVLCGQAGLTTADMHKPCPNVRGLSADEALLEAMTEEKAEPAVALVERVRP